MRQSARRAGPSATVDTCILYKSLFTEKNGSNTKTQQRKHKYKQSENNNNNNNDRLTAFDPGQPG